QRASSLHFSRQHVHMHRRGMLARAVHPLRRANEVTFLREENVRYVPLRVAVNEWEPGAANLHHDAMTRAEGVEHILQLERHLGWLIRRERLGPGVTAAEAAANRFAADHHLIAAHPPPRR